jgi:hypothetical protein
VITASDPLAWRPRIRREPDPRQGELFHDADGLPQPAAVMPEWIVRAVADNMRARRTWGSRRRLRWALWHTCFFSQWLTSPV